MESVGMEMGRRVRGVCWGSVVVRWGIVGVARVIVGWGVRGILEFVDELSWGGWVGKRMGQEMR